MTRWFTKPWSFQKENGVTLLTEGSMSYQQLSPLFTTVAGWTSVLVQLNRKRQSNTPSCRGALML